MKKEVYKSDLVDARIKSLGLIIKKNKVWIVAVFLLAGWFYWFEYRPEMIRKDCTWNAIEALEAGGKDTLDSYYNNCLRFNGLK